MSRATSLVSMMQQLSVSFGVGIAAMLLHITMQVRGESALNAGDFPTTFFIVALLSVTSILIFIPLAPEAGAEVSGHGAASASAP